MWRFRRGSPGRVARDGRLLARRCRMCARATSPYGVIGRHRNGEPSSSRVRFRPCRQFTRQGGGVAGGRCSSCHKPSVRRHRARPRASRPDPAAAAHPRSSRTAIGSQCRTSSLASALSATAGPVPRSSCSMICCSEQFAGERSIARSSSSQTCEATRSSPAECRRSG
jgi:hypothetical protein